DIDAGRDFDQLKSVRRGLKHGSFGHEQGGAAFPHGEFGAVANLFDRADELPVPAFPDDAQLAVFKAHVQTAGGEGPTEDDLARVLADVDEAADADDLVAKSRDIDVT